MDNTNTNISLKELEDLFLAKKYDEARDYLVAKKDTISPGLFHYNMGVILGEQGNLAVSRYHFEIAKKNGFSHPAVYKNLKIVEAGIGVKSKPDSMMEYTADFFSSTSSSIFLFVTLLIVFIMMIVARKLQLSKKFVTAVLILFFMPLIFKSFYFDNKYSTALSLKEVELFQGPSKVYEVIDMIPAGSKLILSKSHSDWVFIEYPIEFSGWIDRSKIAYY